ncbi:MAG: sulfatase-like hydrolase/transferase [Arenimonas sp.]
MDAARRALRASYPYLTAATPVLYLAAQNVAQVTPDQIVAPLLALLVATALMLFAGTRVLGSRALAAILVTLLLLVLFTGGGLRETLVENVGPGFRWPAFALGLALGAGLLYGTWRAVAGRPAREEAATTMLSIMALVLFLNMAVSLASPAKRRVFFDLERVAVDAEPPAHPVLPDESAQFPDVYYIVADAYPRADVLQRYYGYDNSAFIAWLQSRGFYVARDSWSNYQSTYLSLASSLSMRFVDPEIARIRERTGEPDRTALYRLIQRPDVASRLQQKGYRYAQTLTHWGGTDRSASADIRYKFAPFLGSEFASTLANMTLLGALAPTLDELHAFVAAKAVEIASIDGPTFAFVHLLLPHNPYVFDRDGRVVGSHPLTLSMKLQDAAWGEREPFAEQVRHTNTLLKQVIEGILARSDTPPIIILQGDHGSGLSRFQDGVGRDAPDPGERLAILNAYLVPEATRAKLYPGITPVNSFRLLLSTHFGDDVPLLPDRSYYSFSPNPYDLRDVTDELATSSTSGR